MQTENLQIIQIRDRFLKLNRERIIQTQQLMLSTQRDLIELLPLLFHINNPYLPGFVSEKTPSGVFNFNLADNLLVAAKRLWPGVEFSKRGLWQFEIEAIFLMGSCGTVAFNRKSDFDVWLCHRSDLPEEQLIDLQKKAGVIEKWFDSIGIEMHFFLMNADTFKKGEVSSLSTESSGTAQHRLLLDEFYRANIWLAGKIPFWWYVPPEDEKKYAELYTSLIAKGVVSEKDIIDFGGLPDIPTSEFFGAAVWQIYKGVDSPYKSILKITLMESYAGSYPKNTPLSAEFKKNIYNGIDDLELLDPYLMMLHRLEKYLETINEKERLEVIRRSFYLKLNINLTHSREKDNWRKKLIENLVVSWGWSPAAIKHLDEQKNWKLEQVSKERKLLMMHLTKSYAHLSEFARKYAKKRLINQKDLSILGRKLYSVFDRKAGKIEIFNRGIVDSIREESITLMLLFGKDGRDNWRLYRGRVTGDQFKKYKPLKQTLSLIEIISWMHFNQVISDTTQKLLYAPGSEVSSNEFNLVLEILDKINDTKIALESETNVYLKIPSIRKSLVFLNIGKTSNLVNSNADKQLISGEIDVLNYGGKTNCLIQTIEYCYINSWGEIFVFKYYGVEGVARYICDLLTVYFAASKQHRDVVSITPDFYCFGTHISHALSSRFSVLIKSILSSYISSIGVNCYVYEAGKYYYCIHNDNGKFEYTCYKNINLLMGKMSSPANEFRSVAFDGLALSDHVLKTLYSRNEEGVIQVFLQASKDAITVYVLDEWGILFKQKMPVDELLTIGKNFVDFIQLIVEKTHFREDSIESLAMSSSMSLIDESEFEPGKLEIYKLTKQRYHFKATKMDLSGQDVKRPYNVQVIGDVVDNKTVFKFFCNDEEFSTAESGSKIFHVVAKHILKQRRNNERYYVYITDLELSVSLLGRRSSSDVQIVKYLNYKKNIEGKLNKVLQSM